MNNGRIISARSQGAVVRRDGRVTAIEHTAAPIFDGSGKVTGGVLVFHDVSETREMANRLSWQASHDALTGLVNRVEFERRLTRSLRSARDERSHHALCYMDLDQFKIVNDSCGHFAGDQLLKQITELLTSRVRDSDTLARLGGDEFGLLLERCPLEQAQRIAGNLLRAVQDFRFRWQDKVFTIGVSIGIVAITESDQSIAQVMSAADAACYSAKEHGRNRMQVYLAHDADLVRQREQMGWVSRLSRALDEDRFALYFQRFEPLGEKKASSPVHLELLLRMIDEEGRVVAPGAFIPAAERYNLMPAIDRWVVRAAFRAYGGLVRAFGRGLSCSINLSAASLSGDDLAAFIREQAARENVPPQSICFEITETTAINELRKAVDFMTAMKASGFRFALDDFGSGMSSFSYLKNLPVDYLKIDGHFIRELSSDPVSRAMTVAMNQIGHAMGIRTIAEFVENAQTLEELRKIGVDFAQGFFIAKPQPLPEEPAAAAAATEQALSGTRARG